MTSIAKGENPRSPWTVKYRDGNRRQREKSFKTKAEALDFKIKVEHDSKLGFFADPRDGKIIFIEYAARWIDQLDRSPRTKATYRTALNRVKEALDGHTLVQVANDREGVAAMIGGLGGSASSRALSLTVILGAVREAQKAGRIGQHKLDGLTVRKGAEKQATIIPVTSDQLAKLKAGIRPDLGLTVDLMRGCGLRVSEALAVNLANFRNNGTVLRVCEQAGRDGSVAPLKFRRENEAREIPAAGWLWDKVQAHVAEHGTDDMGYLFRSGGRFVAYSSYHQRFMRAAKKAGLADFHEHSLRHLFASTLLAAGVPLSDVAHWLGHADIRITARVYGHLLPDSWTRGRDALETLAA